MTGYLLSPAAQRDIDEIWEYTAERWNQLQAARYVRGIRDVCTGIANGTVHHRPVSVREGYR